MDSRKMIFKDGSMEIPYELSINNRLKYIRISMDTNGMKVSTPSRVPVLEVERLLSSKRKWVIEHYRKFQSMKAFEAESGWKNRGKVLYRGNEYGIEIRDYEGSNVKVSFDGNGFCIHAGTFAASDRERVLHEVIRKWYINNAREVIAERLAFYSGIIGVSYNDVRIKEQKTRWGSCSKKKNLNFNWKLIMAPPWVLDYVAVHELCHLKHLNHSKKYWDMVSAYFPDYKAARDWLKENGARLKI